MRKEIPNGRLNSGECFLILEVTMYGNTPMKQLNLMSMVEKLETNKTIKAREVILPSLIFLFNYKYTFTFKLMFHFFIRKLVPLLFCIEFR